MPYCEATLDRSRMLLVYDPKHCPPYMGVAMNSLHFCSSLIGTSMLIPIPINPHNESCLTVLFSMAETRGVEPLQPFGRHLSRVLQYHYATLPCKAGGGGENRTPTTFRSPGFEPGAIPLCDSTVFVCSWRKARGSNPDDLTVHRLATCCLTIQHSFPLKCGAPTRIRT